MLFLAPSFAQGAFQAGAYAQDITPTTFPVIINGGFTEVIATKANDTLHARALVLADGTGKIAIVVVDSCMLPRELLDDAKSRAGKLTGIPIDRMLIAATHTHSAPSSMGCLGSDADANYVKTLPDLLARAIDQANRRLAPAKIGWTSVNDPDHTACRRWVFRPDRMRNDPFGNLTVRANMHPGYQSPDAISPTGPVDPGLSIVSIQTTAGRPLVVLANYSMHYVGTTPVSADYYGRFCDKIARLVDADSDSFVGIMSQGTSGDMWLADYSKPQPAARTTIDTFADAIAQEVAAALKTIQYTDDAPIVMRETTLKLRRRVPYEKRLVWAKEKLAALGDQKPKTQPDIYAREAVFLHDDPVRELKLQAISIGGLGIAAIPNEVYALTGLKIKGQSPLAMTFTMELANGSEGYIPPPEQHKLGGYTTWPARTAALEEQAEPKIAEASLKLLEEVSGQKRRAMTPPENPLANAVLASKPRAYYRMAETSGPICTDASGNGINATFGDGVVFYLPGPETLPNSRAALFAGGRLDLPPIDRLGQSYSVGFLVWNGLSPDARPVTAYLFSRGPDGDQDAPGDHLGIGGTYDDGAAKGKLIFFNGNQRNQLLVGKTDLALRTWYHVALIRNGPRVTVFLNGQAEITGDTDVTIPDRNARLFFGGRCDNFANLEGKLCDAAVFDRPLKPEEVAAQFRATALPQPLAVSPRPSPQNAPAPLKRPSDPRLPQESMKSIHLPKDLAIELVAAEPLVVDPVAIDFGPDGKLWVVEMADYPYGMDGHGKPGGRIKYLESTKNDGHYDKATLFLDNVRMPNGILAWRDGVIVTAAPDVFFARDADGDGKADQQDVLYTGFKPGNPQLRVNGLRWGLDNWLYLANGWSNGVVTSKKTGKTLDVKGHDLRIHPDTGEMELVSGVSQFGREHDDFGRWFGTDNAHPLFHYTLEEHYLQRNPHIAFGEPKNQLLPLPLPPVFPKSPFAKRYIGLDHHGHFTSACGISLYRDEMLFARTTGIEHAFICEPVHNLVQHQLLSESGSTFAAKRVEGEGGGDFIAAEDPWFRPVMTRCGPDGALWVVDMYRYMIEHPDWLNDEGKKAYAPFYRDGDDKGRIYRVYPADKRPRQIPRMEGLSSAQLVALLESLSGYTRDRAQMMLVWRRDPGAQPLLEKMVTTSPNPMARLHALCALDGVSVAAELKAEILLKALADAHPAVRANAIRIAEPRLTDSAALLDAVIALANDADPMVRLQLLYTMGQVDAPKAVEAFVTTCLDRPLDAPAAVAALSSASGPRFSALVDRLTADKSAVEGPLFAPLLDIAIATQDRAALTKLIAPIRPDDATHPRRTQLEGLAALLDRLAAHRLSVEKLSDPADDDLSRTLGSLSGVFDAARQIAADDARPLPDRLAAVAMLGRQSAAASDDLRVIAPLLLPRSAGELQLAAVRAAARTGRDSVPAVLLAGWDADSPAIRSAIADVLLARQAWARALAGSPAARELDFARRQRLLNHSSPDVKEAARRTLAQDAAAADRQKVIESYHDALTLRPDIKHGEALFGEHCATCHRVGSSAVGHDIGPNLLTVRDWTRENLLTAILDPDRTVEPRYLAYSAALNDGSAFTGLLTAESAAGVTLKTLDDADHVLPRASLKSLASTNHSLMPQGFETTLTPQDVADLVGFVRAESSSSRAGIP
ncbi:MAG TPA: PVC-type heme-binding CxxCH protein [Tepidisphaeraceae bacterium]